MAEEGDAGEEVPEEERVKVYRVRRSGASEEGLSADHTGMPPPPLPGSSQFDLAWLECCA